IIPNSFLANPNTSATFATILVKFLLERLDQMGSNMERSNLYLKLFKLVFGSVSLFASENEQMLKPHLHEIVNRSIELACTSKEPYNYFLLLRALFRSIGGGVSPLAAKPAPSWIPETPRWLAANGSLDEAHRILMKFGGSKGKSLDSAQLRALLDQIRQDQIERIVKAKKDTPVDMFRTSKMRKFSLIVCLHWFVTALLGFGIFLFIMQLAGNIYINYFIMRFLTLLRVFLSWLLYAKFGRRLVFGGFMTGAGVICLIVLAIYQDYPLVTTGIAIAVKIMIDCNWAGIYLMTSEVFPTVLRNTAMGMGSCSARIAAILAPYIVMT
ncbi:predicted protein, partial [Nematostella vectensis]